MLLATQLEEGLPVLHALSLLGELSVLTNDKIFFSEQFCKSVFRFVVVVPAHLPAEHTENQIEHEEGANDDQRHKVDPVVGAAEGVVCL